MGTYFLPLTSQICLLSTPSTELGICQSSLWRHPVPFPPGFPSAFRDSGTKGHPTCLSGTHFLCPRSVSTHPSPTQIGRKKEMHLLLLVIYLFGETEMMGKYLKISLCLSFYPTLWNPLWGNVGSPRGWELFVLPCLPLYKQKGRDLVGQESLNSLPHSSPGKREEGRVGQPRADHPQT